ncbi:MAG: tRNA (adenosine(37)-N6)-threonylcarbamoyltransferase complex transferase subunit TsaD [Planctomycetia bacterium]|nr:tRNA (adenosine(37)-N6)-threonylcarbamoyltransferase complex transferase subunit TsaD [Planctomycetia bacterium]
MEESPVKILTIESSCDETAAAIVNERREVLAAVVASQIGIHERFGGVVPEIASRAHQERILPVLSEVFLQSGLTPRDLDAVAVVNTPGLAGSLLVGLSAAKALALAAELPLIAINHLQAHIYACRVAYKEELFPCLGLIVSGGHSSLYRCQGPIDFTPLGTTIDDAAGEAFDKVAAMLSLPYPGGPAISRLAEQGNPKAFAFPRPMLDDPDRLQFSFSGLKTAVRYAITGPGRRECQDVDLSTQQRADLAASFQEAVVDTLVGKTLHALKKTSLSTVCIGGGVAANKRFRDKMTAAALRHNFRLFIAPMNLCTDNAIMGAIALERYKAGLFESLSLDILPGLVRD